MGHAQQFSKMAMQQLAMALVPLSYLQWGGGGLAVSSAALAYLFLQLRTWAGLMQDMRDAYAEALRVGGPVAADVSALPCGGCRRAHAEGLWGWLTCQLASAWCFALRWRAARGRAVRVAEPPV